jgi:hypothetical protein
MAYESLQLGQPGNPKCPNQYTPESTLICPSSNRLILQISNQAVYVQLGVMPHGKGVSAGSVQWQPEQPFLPIVASLGRRFDAVRVRNYTPGAEAQVLLGVESV